MIQFGQDIYTDLIDTCRYECLETNGLGGFASSTIMATIRADLPQISV
jgi:hypothetical protein